MRINHEQKRTFAAQKGMSALPRKRTCGAAIQASSRIDLWPLFVIRTCGRSSLRDAC
jgi:hypothetical protein